MSRRLIEQEIQEIGSVFATKCQEVLISLSGQDNWTWCHYTEDELLDEEVIIGALVLTGNKHSLLTVKSNRANAERLVEWMTGQREGFILTDLVDGLTELVNMTAGRAKPALVESSWSFEFSLPFAVHGRGSKILSKNSYGNYATVIKSDVADFKLTLYVF